MESFFVLLLQKKMFFFIHFYFHRSVCDSSFTVRDLATPLENFTCRERRGAQDSHVYANSQFNHLERKYVYCELYFVIAVKKYFVYCG